MSTFSHNTKIALLASFILTVPILLYIFYPNIFAKDEDVILSIHYGSDASSVAKLLYENGLIFNKDVFLFLIRITGNEKKIKFGNYKLNKKMNMFQIISKLVKGDVIVTKVTIPEGLTTEQIAELISQKIKINKKKFIEISKKRGLEGYLFPDTYFLYPGITEEDIIKMMVDNYKNKTEEIFKTKRSHLSQRQIIILASIIEKEASDPYERRLISGIFHNRLKKGWLLESCSTVRYAMKKYTGKLTYKDLKFKSPYNTYLYHGLPPTAICNPGLDSIIAALQPLQTELFFFFADGKGTHVFSRYKDEHIFKQRIFKKKRKL